MLAGLVPGCPRGTEDETGGLTRGQGGVVAVGQVAKVQSEALPGWRKRKGWGKGSAKEEERGRVSLSVNGPSPVPPGAMLTSSAGTADRRNSMWLLWAKMCESPWGARVSPLSPPGLQMLRAGIPYSMKSVAGVWVVNFEVRILPVSGLRAATLPWGAPETGLVAHACARCSASVPAKILTLQP